MNAQNAKYFLPLVQALAEGKTLEFNLGTVEHPVWCDNFLKEAAFNSSLERYRIKPEPPVKKLVKWTLAQVPLGAEIRHKTLSGQRALITMATDTCVYFGVTGHSYEYCAEHCEWLAIGCGWQPCGTEVEA